MKFETSVRIRSPIDEVFAYVSDPGNFPQRNSAVQHVTKTSAGESVVGSTYRMERALPSGRAENELEVIAHERPTGFGIRTTSGPTPFVYHYRFTQKDGETLVELDAQVELEGAAALVASLARRTVKKGVDDNFATLKTILEARSAAD